MTSEEMSGMSTMRTMRTMSAMSGKYEMTRRGRTEGSWYSLVTETLGYISVLMLDAGQSKFDVSNHSLSRVEPILTSTVSADVDGFKHVELEAFWFLYV
jgi:hypothetical protein